MACPDIRLAENHCIRLLALFIMLKKQDINMHKSRHNRLVPTVACIASWRGICSALLNEKSTSMLLTD